MLIYLIIIFSIYFGFVLVCIAGWKKFTRSSTLPVVVAKEFVSVVVAVRNEEDSLALLLASLQVQDFPQSNFEIVFVNDHSTDHSVEIISDWIKDNPHIRSIFLNSSGNGKKQALTEGIERASGEIILTTDADCIVPANWISGMVMSFNPGTALVIGLVKIGQKKSLFSKLQALEFGSLIGSGLALNALGYPVMCNGASLAFRKKSFEAVNGYEDNLHIPSGDDEFLMRKLVRQFPGSVQSIQWPSVVVGTRPQPSLKSFIHQRVRWAGKWKANDSISTKMLALFILIFQFSTLLSMGYLLVGENQVGVGILLGMKLLVEGYFLFKVSRTLHHHFSIPAFLILQFAYPVYVVMIGVLSQLIDYEWKGRRRKAVG